MLRAKSDRPAVRSGIRPAPIRETWSHCSLLSLIRSQPRYVSGIAHYFLIWGALHDLSTVIFAARKILGSRQRAKCNRVIAPRARLRRTGRYEPIP